MKMADSNEKGERVGVKYQKSNYFRVIRMDGCWGGVGPRGVIQANLYSERPAIPRKSYLPVENGEIGTEVIEDTEGGLVREVEVGVTMDLGAAISFYIWLRSQMEHMRRQVGVTDEQWEDLIGLHKDV
jgi:hypothetical protein